MAGGLSSTGRTRENSPGTPTDGKTAARPTHADMNTPPQITATAAAILEEARTNPNPHWTDTPQPDYDDPFLSDQDADRAADRDHHKRNP